jgi:hypothetical protein
MNFLRKLKFSTFSINFLLYAYAFMLLENIILQNEYFEGHYILVFVVCLPMAELVYLTLFTVLSGAPNTQSARQTPKYCFLLVSGARMLLTQHSSVQALPSGV